MSYLGVGVSPANVPVNKATDFKATDRRVRLTELILRLAISGLAVLAAVLLATAHQVKEVFMIKKSAKYTQMKALSFLVITNGIVAAYSLLQGLRCIFSIAKGHVLLSKPLAWFILSGDQLVAYLTMSAVAAAAQSAALAKFGNTELQWLQLCDIFGRFCNQIGEGIATGLLVSIGMAAVASISAFSLFRLYGGGKKTSTR